MKISGLFKYIESAQGQRPWGDILDAGTGANSLRWISTLNTKSITAVTASASMAQNAKDSYPGTLRDNDEVAVGNWIDESLMSGRQFDTVLLDYFVGAVDGFAPYWQDLVLERFRPLLKPGGRLYITALQPYVPLVEKSEVGRYVGDVGRLRDACLLLAGERPYREYPADWMARHLQRANFTVIDSQRFPIRFGERWVESQLRMCRSRTTRFANPAVTQSMLQHIENMHNRGMELIERHNGLPYGFDYIITAEAVSEPSTKTV